MVLVYFSIIIFYFISTNADPLRKYILSLNETNLRQFPAYESNNYSLSSNNLSILYAIITGQNSNDRSQYVFESWVQYVCTPHRVLFVTDGPLRMKPPFPYIVAFNLPKNATNREHYRNSQYKWLEAIVHAASEVFDWLVLVDDDSFVIHHAMLHLLHGYNPAQALLIGKRGSDCDKVCGGPGLLLSRELVRKLTSDNTTLSRLRSAFVTGVGPHRKRHADVVLSHFVGSAHGNGIGKGNGTGVWSGVGVGRLVHRNELKNFPPSSHSRWYTSAQPRLREQLRRVVSIHHLANDVSVYRTYARWYYNSSRKCPLSTT